MRLLDRYILKEFMGPFLFGMGSFAVMVIGVVIAPMLLKLMIREHFPASTILVLFLYRLPQVVVFTLPMATVFGAVMTMTHLSGTGELIAVRAGGASLWRLAAPILTMGFLVSVTNVTFSEVLVPASLDAAWKLQSGMIAKLKPVRDLSFAIPQHNPKRFVFIRSFDPRRKVLEGVSIVELKDGEPWQTLGAKTAEWSGRDWLLRDVHIKWRDKDDAWSEFHTDLRAHDLGKDPEELAQRPVLLDEMSVAQLQEELARRQRDGMAYKPHLIQVIQYINTHIALPWVPFFFTLVGVPLGMRPSRATTGVGLGLSLVIALAFYVLFHSMHLVGQTGAIPSALAAWTPNAILCATGIGLFIHAGK